MEPVKRAVRAIRSLPQLLRRTIAAAWGDRVLGLSAETAFWQLLSLPSLLIALIATLGYVSRLVGHNTAQRTETQLQTLFSRAFSPEVVQQLVTPTLKEVLSGTRADIASIGFALALWAGSSAMATFVNTITIAYGMRELRGAVRSRLLALWLFLGSVLVGVVVLPLLVLGPTVLADLVPRRDRANTSAILHAAYYPGVIILLLLGLTTLYHLAPPRRLPWRRGVPGALLAILVFLAGSACLRTYIRFILSRNHAYGTLAAPVAALLFFFVLALGVLLGAEFNAVIETTAPTPDRQPRVLHPRKWRRAATAPADPPSAPGTVDTDTDTDALPKRPPQPGSSPDRIDS